MSSMPRFAIPAGQPGTQKSNALTQSNQIYSKLPSPHPSEAYELTDVSESDLLPPTQVPSEHAETYVRWGVERRQPALMVAFAVCGILLAIGHHIYYLSLNGEIVSSTTRQQWPIRFGTAFAYLTQASLAAAVGVAATQRIWTVLRRENVSIGGIDKIFAIVSDPTALLSLELARLAKVAVALAVIFWCLPLAAIVPPATLSVEPALQSEISSRSVPTLDWGTQSWFSEDAAAEGPASPVLKVATQAAQEFSIARLTAPTVNSSYSYSFHGPSTKCLAANNTQQPIFDKYTADLWNESCIVSPAGAPVGSFPCELESGVKYLIFSSFTNPTLYGIDLTNEDPQLWLQTANESLVCNLVDATFNIDILFDNGRQEVALQTVDVTNAYLSAPVPYTYLAVFQSLASNIVGNVTVTPGQDGQTQSRPYLWDRSRNVLATGLTACKEFVHPYWADHPNFRGPNKDLPALRFNSTSSSSVYPSEPWMCRNRTLSGAIEDLINNMTISMLSLPDITNTASIPVNITSSRNVYAYGSRNLLVSYSIAIIFTLVAVSIGLVSFHVNGVSHDRSFSAIMTTTRNPDLDTLSRGQSLGALPLAKDLKRVKLQFGVLRPEQSLVEHEAFGAEERLRRAPHAAFGLYGHVSRLEKGVKCI